MPESVLVNRKDTQKRQKHWLFYVGIVFVVLSFAGISYFVLTEALAGFPTGSLSSAKKWLFIGSHAVAGILGLIFLSIRK